MSLILARRILVWIRVHRIEIQQRDRLRDLRNLLRGISYNEPRVRNADPRTHRGVHRTILGGRINVDAEESAARLARENGHPQRSLAVVLAPRSCLDERASTE